MAAKPSFNNKIASEGAVAQLGERRPCKAEVVGSTPISSTKKFLFMFVLCQFKKKGSQNKDGFIG